MRGLDPFRISGALAIERAPDNGSGVTFSGLPKWTTFDTDGDAYIITSDGKLYFSSNMTTWEQMTGNPAGCNGGGLVVWNEYVLLSRVSGTDVIVDCTPVVNAGGAVSFSSITFTGLNTSGNIATPMFVASNRKVFIGGGNKVLSLEEVSGQTFDPSNGATYTASISSTYDLKLPDDSSVSCFSELGDKLEIGTVYGSSVASSKKAEVFPWDMGTTSSFGLPIRLNEEGVNALIVSNNLLYISAGRGGRIYVSNGASAALSATVPIDFKAKAGGTGASACNLRVYPDALEFQGNEMLVGISQGSDASKQDNPIGVFSFVGSIARFLGNTSDAKDGSDGTIVEIGTIYSVSPTELLVGWRSGSNYGIDYFSPANSVIASYGAFCDTEIFTLGSNRNPAAPEFYDFYLAKPLVSGDGIRLQYRVSNTGSWTTLATMDYATMCPNATETVNTWSFRYSIKDIRTIQFRVLLTGTSTTTPELRAIIVS